MGEPDNPEQHPLVCGECGTAIDPAAGMYHSPDLFRSYHPACYDALNTVPTMVILSGRPREGATELAEQEQPSEEEGAAHWHGPMPRPLGQPVPSLGVATRTEAPPSH
jgi:hypothetical protein